MTKFFVLAKLLSYYLSEIVADYAKCLITYIIQFVAPILTIWAIVHYEPFEGTILSLPFGILLLLGCAFVIIQSLDVILTTAHFMFNVSVCFADFVLGLFSSKHDSSKFVSRFIPLLHKE